MKPSIDIIITSFNGKHLLEKHLPQVIAASPEASRIIVVDDASADDTVSFLKENHPRVHCIANISNQGFTKSTNIGVAESKADFVVILNNDVYPEKGYLKSSLKYFDDPKIFAVTFNEVNSSWPKIDFSGKVQYTQGEKTDHPILSAWASGGSSVIRRRLWQALGGFNELFTPGYWEDIDLGWRAWKMGYKIIWDPGAKVVHQHESTFSKLNPGFVSLVKQRNELLFNWQNITQKDLLVEHVKFLFTYTFAHPGYLKVIWAALQYLPRLKYSKATPYSDSYILHTANQRYKN